MDTERKGRKGYRRGFGLKESFSFWDPQDLLPWRHLGSESLTDFVWYPLLNVLGPALGVGYRSEYG